MSEVTVVDLAAVFNITEVLSCSFPEVWKVVSVIDSDDEAIKVLEVAAVGSELAVTKTKVLPCPLPQVCSALETGTKGLLVREETLELVTDPDTTLEDVSLELSTVPVDCPSRFETMSVAEFNDVTAADWERLPGMKLVVLDASGRLVAEDDTVGVIVLRRWDVRS